MFSDERNQNVGPARVVADVEQLATRTDMEPSVCVLQVPVIVLLADRERGG